MPVSRDVCQVDVYIHTTAGDPTLNDYYVSIWTVGASNVLGTKLGTSAKVDGAAWSTEYVTFTFSTPVTVTGDFIVAIWMDNDGNTTDYEYDGTNYIVTQFQATDTWVAGLGRYVWTGSTGAVNGEDLTYDVAFKIYTMQ